MLGSLVVRGDVQNTFCVYASGDVEIRGGVDNGSVHAGGSLQVQRGVRGSSGSRVSADQDLSAQQAEYAELVAGGLLRVGSAVHSKLVAQRVEITGKVRGGVARAELGVLVSEAGSSLGVRTELDAGVPLELPIEAAQRALERAKATRNVRLGASPRGERAAREKGDKLGRVQASLQSAEVERLRQRERRRAELSDVAFVQIGVAHPGVVVRISGKELELEHESRRSRFSLDPKTRDLRRDEVAR
jgi:hypothetical protein